MNAFSAWVGIGSALGLWRVWRTSPSRLSGSLLNSALLVLLAALLGARLAYIGINNSYFRANPLEALQMWQGGLSWPGTVAGAAAAIALMTQQYAAPPRKHVPLGWLADRLYPLLAPVAITAWLGCWQVGVAYGSVLPAGTWWGIPGLDETGAYRLHVPVQPLAALALLAYFALLEQHLPIKRQPGLLAGLAFGGLMLVQLGASLLRADPVPTWQGLRLDGVFAAVSLSLLLMLALLNALVPQLWREQSISDHS